MSPLFSLGISLPVSPDNLFPIIRSPSCFIERKFGEEGGDVGKHWREFLEKTEGGRDIEEASNISLDRYNRPHLYLQSSESETRKTDILGQVDEIFQRRLEANITPLW